MVIRKQISGLCYLHSVVLMEHFLFAISTKGEASSTYDIGKYEANALSGDKLVDFLLKGEGGNSLMSLYELCCLKEADTVPVTIPRPNLFPLGYNEVV